MAFSSCRVLISAVAVAHVTAVHVPALLHSVHKGQEALSLESEVNKSRCPQVNNGKDPSILFMHIEKTGGTVMRQMLKAVLPSFDSYQMVDGNDPGHLTQNSKNEHFVIGLVRRPCDYMLSRYFMGLFVETQSREQMEKLGNKEDFREVIKKLTSGTLDKQHTEKYLMSVQIAKRYGNKQNADCWMRTHNLKSDFIECLRQFQACGGKVTSNAVDLPNVVEAAMHETAEEMAKEHSRSVGNHPACTEMFDEDMLQKVLQTQQTVIDEYDLGVCCSSDPKSLVHDGEIAELPPFFDLDWQID